VPSENPTVASPYIERILKARVYDVAQESPLELAPALSKRLGSRQSLAEARAGASVS